MDKYYVSVDDGQHVTPFKAVDRVYRKDGWLFIEKNLKHETYVWSYPLESLKSVFVIITLGKAKGVVEEC